MNKDNGLEEGLIIKANETDVEILAEDFPSAEESDIDPTLISTSEPEPFDPMTSIKYPEQVDEPISGEVASGEIEISAEQEAAMERAYSEKGAPTPESIAAELKAAANMKLAKYEDDTEGNEEKPAKKKKPIVTIVILLIIMAIAGVAVAHVLLSNGKNLSLSNNEQSSLTETPIERIVGSWKSNVGDGSCYIFTENEEFYWSKRCSDLDNNYDFGKILDVRQGNSALGAAKRTEEEIKNIFPAIRDSFDVNSVYYFELQTTDRKIGQDGEYNLPNISSDPVGFIFVRINEKNEASAYRFDSGDMYELNLDSEITTPERSVLSN
ncbi:MAG: hypothetical protein MJ154_01045 [Candidatus Saccharibacteria bacterium]|nr:hypothetical protein [Candidatus Saccharibacteria bacterium]